MVQNRKAVKLAPTAAPAGNVVKKSVFAFKTRPAIAPTGLQKGTLVSALNEVGVENGKEVNRVAKTVKLEAADGKGNHFVLTKNYNVMPSGRGFTAFTTDFNGWSGAGLTEDDLYVERDYTSEFGGQQLVVEVGHRKVGKDWQAYIIGFHPANTTELAAA